MELKLPKKALVTGAAGPSMGSNPMEAAWKAHGITQNIPKNVAWFWGHIA